MLRLGQLTQANLNPARCELKEEYSKERVEAEKMNIKSPLSILLGYVEMASNAMGQWL